jgi:hypothetical protein
MAAILVAGTNSWDNDGAVDWFVPGHNFGKMLRAHGVEVASDGPLPFIWSTDVDGVIGDRKNNTDWAAAGAALSYFTRMTCGDCSVDMVAHSHGLQVALYAAANYGVKIDRLISMGSPVRKDMEKIAKEARLHIKQWLHVHSDTSDRWQWLGELFDGKLGVVREHPLADRNDFVPKVGHSELLRDPNQYHFWKEKGWLDFLCGKQSLKP